jgi:hypothetical protein
MTDAEYQCQLFYFLSFIFKKPGHFSVPLPFKQALFASGLIIDAPGEGAVETGFNQFTTFILVVVILWW